MDAAAPTALVTEKVLSAISLPVAITTGLLWTDALAAIAICADADVALVTVTGPGEFAAAPPTEIPGPKLAVVAPWAKLEKVPLMAIESDCPCFPVAGTKATLAGGSMVRFAVFVLLKATPPAVVPAMLTRYGVGELITRDDGTVNVTVAVVPAILAKPDAVVDAPGADPVVPGTKDTVMLLADIAPAGNPLPVTRTDCTLGSAAVGIVEDDSVTCASALSSPSSKEPKRTQNANTAGLHTSAATTLRIIAKTEVDMVPDLDIHWVAGKLHQHSFRAGGRMI
jgi:hypothetical protein